jgi:hypothetical protein
MAGTLRYQALAHPAPDYLALRPAMALREDLMKQSVDRILDRQADALFFLPTVSPLQQA